MAAVVAGALFAAGTAYAAGVSTTRFGADHGAPEMANPYAVYYNPAALGGMTGTAITADGTLAIRQIHVSRDPSALSPVVDRNLQGPSYVQGNTGDARLLNVIATPFIGFASDLGTKAFRVGAATYIPFGGQSVWRKVSAPSDAPGAVDGPQRWHSISGEQTALFNSLAFAYRLENPRISFGAAVHFIFNKLATVRARNADGSDDMFGPTGGFAEGRSYLDVSGFNVGASFGVYYEPLPTLRLGLSYVSQPAFGEFRMSGTLQNQLAVAGIAKPEDVDLLMSYPDVIRLGAAYRVVPRVELRGDFQYERYSVFDHQCVVSSGADCNVGPRGQDLTGGKIITNIIRDWQDAVRLRLGGAYFFDRGPELFGSTGFGTSAIPARTQDATYLDGFNLFFTYGVRHTFLRHLAAALSYTFVYYFPVHVEPGESQLFSGYDPPSRTPSADGRYAYVIHFLNANVTYTF